MTIKEKAKAYDEAKARMSRAFNSNRCTIGFMDEIFPELKESEDERIRKELIEHIKDNCETGFLLFQKFSPDEIIAWLEKQGESKSYSWKPTKEQFEALDYAYNSCSDTERGNYYEGVLESLIEDLHRFEKQGEQKSIDNLTPQEAMDIAVAKCFENQDKKKLVDNVEPKFKVGDWVVNKLGDSWHIDSFDKKYYQVSDRKGNYNYFPITKQDEMRLWTIQDAEDGDVLTYVTDEEDLWIMIYQSLYEPYEGHVHYHAFLVNDNFSDKGTCCICIDDLNPATKEQRDFLFKRMREAGYEWDAKNKELRKIEQVSEWSEEDEHRAKDTTYFLDTAKKHYASTVELDACIDWLKSLKQRMEVQQ